MKLGQILASVSDLIPPAYIEALPDCRTRESRSRKAEAQKIIEDELGVRISKAFSRFEAEPIAAASLGQVHRAALRDGREVVVKVQRPGIAPQIADDFEALAEVAAFVEEHSDWARNHRITQIVEELRVSIGHELDYAREAQNLVTMGANLQRFDRLTCRAHCRLLHQARLTMGTCREPRSGDQPARAPGDRTGRRLPTSSSRPTAPGLVDGLFHADPHPGNVFLTQDTFALLDRQWWAARRSDAGHL